MTKEIADLTGVHPNTVRLYEEWGYISEVKRAGNNYRQFTERHLDEMKLARIALPGPYPIDGYIVNELVRKYASSDFKVALRLASEYLHKVEIEIEEALEAIGVLDRWFENSLGSKDKILYKTRKATANKLKITIDMLRTWERNGLFTVRRSESGRLIFSEWDIEKIKVIRLLRNCGYSIASLLNVFQNQKDDIKPSELLNLPVDNNDFYYVTDRYMHFLNEHKERAERLISLIKNK
ncbi:MerR family transcriptional regulator [Iocasia frigidifontis]|uniref:MerR family transcriptional regulator n=1 Tax=Iocasia fonsfrigidae TaxID=2682810 RepID=A0A8A7K6S4_9FIRM|nr:MerR family transcriptional regulator [Iocasia fonsfrigidae]QTL97416.1 MerR family transcriptional regulator [Iocasia fonsfrigidae]